MLEVFEAMCTSSEDSSGREDGLVFQPSDFSKKHGEKEFVSIYFVTPVTKGV